MLLCSDAAVMLWRTMKPPSGLTLEIVWVLLLCVCSLLLALLIWMAKQIIQWLRDHDVELRDLKGAIIELKVTTDNLDTTLRSVIVRTEAIHTENRAEMKLIKAEMKNDLNELHKENIGRLDKIIDQLQWKGRGAT